MEPKQHFICFSSEFCAKKFYASLKSPEVTNSTQQLGSFLYFFCFFFSTGLISTAMTKYLREMILKDRWFILVHDFKRSFVSLSTSPGETEHYGGESVVG